MLQLQSSAEFLLQSAGGRFALQDVFKEGLPMSTTPTGANGLQANGGEPTLVGRQCLTRCELAVTMNLGSTERIPCEMAAGGTLYVPLGSLITSLTAYAAPARSESFLPLYDKSGNAVVLTVVAGRCYELPAAVFGCAALKLVGDAAGSVDISLKG